MTAMSMRSPGSRITGISRVTKPEDEGLAATCDCYFSPQIIYPFRRKALGIADVDIPVFSLDTSKPLLWLLHTLHSATRPPPLLSYLISSLLSIFYYLFPILYYLFSLIYSLLSILCGPAAYRIP